MLYRPSSGPISSQGRFGWRQLPGEAPTYHGGIDFVGALGSTVRAVKDGVVYVAAPNGTYNRYGNLIVLKHDDPREAPYSLYAHLNSLRVYRGQRVKAGQPIGTMGNTSADRCVPGKFCDPNHKVATHLHFELLKAFPAQPDVGRVDPTSYLSPGMQSPVGAPQTPTYASSATPALYPAIDQGPVLYPSYGGPMAGLGEPKPCPPGWAVTRCGMNSQCIPPRAMAGLDSSRWTSTVPRPFAPAPGTGLGGIFDQLVNAEPEVKVLVGIGLLPFVVAGLRAMGVLKAEGYS